jgi:hypothetical protein
MDRKVQFNIEKPALRSQDILASFGLRGPLTCSIVRHWFGVGLVARLGLICAVLHAQHHYQCVELVYTKGVGAWVTPDL